MSGIVPSGLAHIPRLTYLYLYHNQFSGRIPDAFYKHPFLKEMMKISGAREENKEESSSVRDGKIKPQKTQSFRGEKKKSHGWMRKRFSRSMSWDYDFRGEDYQAAVAAAAFAVQSHEESTTMDQKKIPDYTIVDPASSIRKKLTSSDKKTTTTNKPEEAGSTTVRPAAPSFKKIPPISDNKPTTSIQLEDAVPTKKDAEGRTTTSPAPPPPLTVQTRQSSRKLGPGETDADTWEKAERARIKQRYQKLIMVIENWEEKKKKKAKNKLDRTQAELDKRRTRAMQSYSSEVTRIEDIAKGASKKADKNRVDEEDKVKNKANKIRSTGKLPLTHICC